MRAVRFHTFGGPGVLAIEDDVPEPPAGPGQVRVRVQAASVNPVDWKIRSGMLKRRCQRRFHQSPVATPPASWIRSVPV